MARNEPRIGGHFLDGVLNVAYIPTHIPSASQINVRKAAGEKCIAKMDNVRRGKVNNTVAIGMRRWNMNDLDFLAVEVD